MLINLNLCGGVLLKVVLTGHTFHKMYKLLNGLISFLDNA